MAAHRPAPSGSSPAGGIGSALQAMRQRKWLGTVALIAALAAVWLTSDLRTARTVATVPYSVFEEYLREGQLIEVQVGDRLITGTLRLTARRQDHGPRRGRRPGDG